LLDYVSGDFQQPLYLLFGAVTAVLLIACANVAGLLLARGFARRHEFGIRVALGAKPSHIVRQVLIESTVLACCAGVLGVSLAFVLLQTFLGLAPVDLPRLSHVRIDGIVLAFAFLVSLLTGVSFGVVSSLCNSRPPSRNRISTPHGFSSPERRTRPHSLSESRPLEIP
jgi:ABC-type antimicrobial peptide transport system permease subunit